MTELINDVFNSFYAKIRKDAALLHVQMLELQGAASNCCSSDVATINTNDGCNMNALKELEGRVMEIVKGLEQRLESNFKQRFEQIEKTLALLMESDSSDEEHEQIAPAPTPEPESVHVKITTPRRALPIPSKEVSPEASEEEADENEEEAAGAEENEEEAADAEENEEEAADAEENEERGVGANDSSERSESPHEEEEAELTEFQFRGKTYYLDNENNVYGLDADGELIQEPVGVRDEKTGRIKMTVSV
jgi:hypothetical protein